MLKIRGSDMEYDYPSQHPDWERWNEGKSSVGRGYYCKLDGHGTQCPDCKYRKTCIMRIWTFSELKEWEQIENGEMPYEDIDWQEIKDRKIPTQVRLDYEFD